MAFCWRYGLAALFDSGVNRQWERADERRGSKTSQPSGISSFMVWNAFQ